MPIATQELLRITTSGMRTRRTPAVEVSLGACVVFYLSFNNRKTRPNPDTPVSCSGPSHARKERA